MRRWFRQWKRERQRGSVARRGASTPIPAFPQATLAALRMLRDPDSNPAAIAEAIDQNPGLVVQLLRVVNSAAYGLRREATRTSHALNLLGRTKVESILVAFAVKHQLDDVVRNGAAKDHWEQAALRASAARGFARLVHPESQAECFVGAMLLDIGVPVLAAEFPEDYRDVLERWTHEQGLDLVELENEAVGLDHAAVGEEMARAWELPAFLQNVIAHHHGGGDVPPAIGLVANVASRDAVDLVVAQASRIGIDGDTARSIWEQAELEASGLAEQFR
ncbi:MAG: HDOD domain-containing protein [Myxococcota bacterium]